MISDEQWALTLEVNVTANFLLVEEIGKLLRDQGLAASIVLTSSANAVVPKRGSEAYDVSKAALSHLIRELAVSQAPHGARQWHQPGNGGEGIDDVSARSRHCLAEEIQHSV